jgi:hypothetical protein
MLRFHLMKIPRARVIAFYLPQFHPIPENDEWWGRGFTEWTNVGKAQPMFSGHYQPHVPADLGFYALRLPETRATQAEMAQAHGIEAFCYWHYCLRVEGYLSAPSPKYQVGEPVSLCLAWGIRHGRNLHGDPDRILIEQTYPSAADHEAHFNVVLEAFGDERYVRDGKPPSMSTAWRLEASRFTDLWRNLRTAPVCPGPTLWPKGQCVESGEIWFRRIGHVNLPSSRVQPWWRPCTRLQWSGGSAGVFRQSSA